MLPQLIVGIGLGIVLGSIFGMYWCTTHRSFGTCDGGMPHYTNLMAGALWVPVFLGLVTIWLGVYLFAREYGTWPS